MKHISFKINCKVSQNMALILIGEISTFGAPINYSKFYKFAISLCTEEGRLNSTETAILF